MEQSIVSLQIRDAFAELTSWWNWTIKAKCLNDKYMFVCFLLYQWIHLLLCSLLQSLWDPASGEGREELVPVWLFLFLHRHFLHCGLRRRHATDLALTAAGGHSHLCRSGGPSTAGTDAAGDFHTRPILSWDDKILELVPENRKCEI